MRASFAARVSVGLTLGFQSAVFTVLFSQCCFQSAVFTGLFSRGCFHGAASCSDAEPPAQGRRRESTCVVSVSFAVNSPLQRELIVSQVVERA